MVALLALIVATAAWSQLRAMRRRFGVLWGDGPPSDVATTLHAHVARVDALQQQVDATQQQVAAFSAHVSAGLRHLSVVRYDAFGDMGGRLSFSAAILDDSGDGLVLSSVHARGESRTYAKGVVAGRSELALTPEEQQAVASALADRPDA